jgi:hypothetical protein
MNLVPHRSKSKKDQALKAAKKVNRGKALKAGAAALVGLVTLSAIRRKLAGRHHEAPIAPSSPSAAPTPDPGAPGSSSGSGPTADPSAPEPANGATPPHGDKLPSS